MSEGNCFLTSSFLLLLQLSPLPRLFAFHLYSFAFFPVMPIPLTVLSSLATGGFSSKVLPLRELKDRERLLLLSLLSSLPLSYSTSHADFTGEEDCVCVIGS